MSELTIQNMGAQGDGVARTDGKAVHIPFTLPGERVDSSRFDGDPEQISSASPARVKPACTHFGRCGSCKLQHWSAQPYLEWKSSLVAQAFTKLGLTPKIEPCFPCPVASRRRVTLTAERAKDGVVLGYFDIDGAQIVDLSQCSIASPVITAQFDSLRTIAASLLRGSQQIQLLITECSNGLDIDVSSETPPTEDMIAAFVRSVSRSVFLRASINRDVVVEKEKPLADFTGILVPLPPGGFLQAVQVAETKMADLVQSHLSGCKNVVDLFSGSGTFATRLARRSNIHAVELETEALTALSSANGSDGLKKISTESRDLVELPLTKAELRKFDGVCLDPPRAGAKEQIDELAKTNISKIAYVSCNPKTLARDAALLIEGGYEINTVTPIDQFLYSPHVEIVTTFTKKADRKSKSIFRKR